MIEQGAELTQLIVLLAGCIGLLLTLRY